MGNWRFTIIRNLSLIVVVWKAINIALVPALRCGQHPFILLNILFSMSAAYAALIMMSQTRATQRDKAQAEHKYDHQETKLAENTAAS